MSRGKNVAYEEFQKIKSKKYFRAALQEITNNEYRRLRDSKYVVTEWSVMEAWISAMEV